METEDKLLMKNTTIITAKDITELMHKATRHQLGNFSDKKVYTANALHLFNVQLFAKSCVYQYDIRKLWLFRNRWTKLIRQYIDKDNFHKFIEQATSILNGKVREGTSTNMLFKDPKRSEASHRWGGCLMGLTFHGQLGKHPTITMYSRTCFMGYIGLLDVAIPALIIAKKILTGCSDTTAADIEFRWYISAMQLHTFKILPYIHSQPDLLKELKYHYRHRGMYRPKNIVWKNIFRWYCKIKDNYYKYGTDMLKVCKYGAWRRIQRRWLEYEEHIPKKKPKSLLIAELDFEKLL